MKQIISYLSITCGIFLFAACHPYVEYVKVRTYKAKDYITKELEVYEPRELLYPILDSIIIKTRECPEYEKTKDCLAFDFSIREEAPYDLENRKGYPYLSISVIYYVPRLTCHHWTKAVFYYKGCSFYVIDTLADLFCKKQTEKFLFLTLILINISLRSSKEVIKICFGVIYIKMRLYRIFVMGVAPFNSTNIKPSNLLI